MNCEDFKSTVIELAEGKPMEATRRVTGMAHATICPECAQELGNAQALCVGMRLAVSAETEEAPVRLRESLLAAFAERRTGTIATAPVVAIPSRQKLGWWAAAAAAVAAVVLLALILPGLMRVSPPPALTAGQAGQPVPLVVKPAAAPPSEVPERKAVMAKNRRPRRAPALARVARPVQQKETELPAGNTTNEYFPLTYLASATAMESGTVVRVQLTRAALISLGLPMNNDRTDGPIKADLVMGDDGVARAIRLVQ